MRVSALEGHAIWSAVYDGSPNPLVQLERRVVIHWLPPLLHRTFVDVACGTGRWARYAAGQGAHVFGADSCAPMLNVAAASLRPRFVQADALRLPFPHRLSDLTMCALAAGYIECPARLIAELARITRIGGVILLTDVHPSALALGWRRSFRRAGEIYEMEHHAHPVGAYLTAARGLGLQLERIEEAPFGEPERAVFEQCGRAGAFASVCRVPALFAVQWRRA